MKSFREEVSFDQTRVHTGELSDSERHTLYTSLPLFCQISYGFDVLELLRLKIAAFKNVSIESRLSGRQWENIDDVTLPF